MSVTNYATRTNNSHSPGTILGVIQTTTIQTNNNNIAAFSKGSRVPSTLTKEVNMIRMIAAAGFALAVATSAQAMTPAPLAQPDHMVTQVRQSCGMGRVMINGLCQS
jgi:hypothetical protein